MATLTTISEKIRRFGWIPATTILAVLFGSLIYLQFSRRAAPPSPAVEQIQFESFEGTTQTFNTQNLSMPVNYPRDLPIYSVDSPKNLLADSNTFASKFSFKDQPINLQDDDLFGSGLLFSDENGTLSIYRSLVVYQKYLTGGQPASFNIAQLKPIAANLLSELRLNQNLAKDPDIIFQKLQGETLGPSQEKDASFIRFHYGHNLSGAPLTSSKEGADVTLDATGDIIQFSYRELSFTGKNDSHKIISPQKALTNLTAGKGALINISGDVEGAETIKNLGIINLQRAYLAYYLPIKSPGDIQPVWVFEGLTNPLGLAVDVQFAIPAIAQ